MAHLIMRYPQVHMHGPEHHYIVPAVLLTAYYNLRSDRTRKGQALKEAEKRARNVLGGFCGFYGDCGAAVGTGIFISIITGATPLSRMEWRLSNMMTAQSLRSIALYGGPRGCKRNTTLALLAAATFLREQCGISLPIGKPPICEFSALNNECLQADCPFYVNAPNPTPSE
jgi:hypothetical protein